MHTTYVHAWLQSPPSLHSCVVTLGQLLPAVQRSAGHRCGIRSAPTDFNITMPLLPNIQWAQRKDRLYLTIDLQNAKDPTIKLDNGSDGKHGHVSFKGKAQSHATGADAHEYEAELDLFGAIDSEESKISTSDRSVFLVIAKQEPSTFLHHDSV